MARDNRVRASDEELALLRKAKEVWFGEDAAEEVTDGKAIGAISKFVIEDQGTLEDAEEAHLLSREGAND